MNLPFFISKRLLTAKENNNQYTRPIIRIAILAIALSVAVMLLAISIVQAFKYQIRDKVIGFGSHIQITASTFNTSYENNPITLDAFFYPIDSLEINKKSEIQRLKKDLNLLKKELKASEKTQKDLIFLKTFQDQIDLLEQDVMNLEELAQEIKHIQVYATKSGIAKNKEETLGIVLKGISNDFNWEFFNNHLVSGEIISIQDSSISNKILISENISKKLLLNVEDDLIIYFLDSKARKFNINGIYNTGLSDFDDLVVLSDIKHIQRLNKWNTNQVGGYEITIDNFENIDKITALIDKNINYDLIAESIKDKNPLFDWLDLQNVNARIIIILMLIVGSINMITALLILVLERIKFIGILKTLGLTNWSLSKVFLYKTLYLVVQGIFFGNLIGLGIAFLQQRFNLIKLNPETYYMTTVPIHFDFFSILLINLGTILICWIALLIPSFIITKINPIKSIDFH